MLLFRAGVVLLLRPAVGVEGGGGGSGGGSGGGCDLLFRRRGGDAVFFATDDALGKGLTLLRGVGGGVWPLLFSDAFLAAAAAALTCSCSFASFCFCSAEFSFRNRMTSFWSTDFARRGVTDLFLGFTGLSFSCIS